MDARELLAQFTELMNRHGANSKEVESFITTHSKNRKFVELAKTAQDLKIALLRRNRKKSNKA